jgi:hypothetical protein
VTPTPTDNSSGGDEGDDGLDEGATAGVAVGSIFLVGIGGFIAYSLFFKEGNTIIGKPTPIARRHDDPNSTQNPMSEMAVTRENPRGPQY